MSETGKVITFSGQGDQGTRKRLDHLDRLDPVRTSGGDAAARLRKTPGSDPPTPGCLTWPRRRSPPPRHLRHRPHVREAHEGSRPRDEAAVHRLVRHRRRRDAVRGVRHRPAVRPARQRQPRRVDPRRRHSRASSGPRSSTACSSATSTSTTPTCSKEPAHPSDNLAAVLAVGEAVGAGGKRPDHRRRAGLRDPVPVLRRRQPAQARRRSRHLRRHLLGRRGRQVDEARRDED